MGLYAARLIDPVGWRAGTETGPYASVITESTTCLNSKILNKNPQHSGLLLN